MTEQVIEQDRNCHYDLQSSNKCRYLIANAFGGEPTPPATLSGDDVRKNV